MTPVTLLSAIEASAKRALELAESDREAGQYARSVADEAAAWARTAQILAQAASTLNDVAPPQEETISLPIEINLDGKTVAQSVLRHTLRRMTQGNNTLKGGSLVTGQRVETNNL